MSKVSNKTKISRKASTKESCDFHFSRVDQVVRFLEDEDDDDGWWKWGWFFREAHFLVSIAIFLKFHCFRYFKNYWNYWIPYAHAPTFMCTLNERVRNCCACLAFASGTDAHPDKMHQFLMCTVIMHIIFPIFAMFILYTYVSSACAWGTDACTENARQELMRTLSIHIRYWCVRWAY